MQSYPNESNLPQAETTSDRPIPKLGPFGQWTARLGGASPRQLLKFASSKEVGDFIVRGLLILISMATNTLGFGVIAHSLYGDGQFSVRLAALAALWALFVGVADVCCLYRFPLHRQGVKELIKAGLHLPSAGGYASVIVTGVRIVQGVVTGAIVAFFLSMAAYRSDITARIERDYLTDNRAVIEQVSPAYDASITRATNAVNDQVTLTRTLDRQVGVLQKAAVRATIRASRAKGAGATTKQDSVPELASLETKRTAEYGRLDSLKAELARLMEERNAGIQKAVDSSPDRKPRRDGFLGRVTTFIAILHENPKLLFIVAGIETIALSLELAPVLGHCIYVPSTYAAALALEHFRRTSALAREGAALIGRPAPLAGNGRAPSNTTGGDLPEDDNERDATAQAPPVVPLKRKRGRPSKASLNGNALTPRT